MVQKVVREVIADVSEDTSTEDGRCGIPIPEEDRVGKLPEGRSEDDEESGRHHQSQLIHGKIVMNTVEQEM